MAELTTLELGIIIFCLSFIFVSGLCWCFCCGTCVGRSLLRQFGFFERNKQRKNQDYIPLHTHEQQWEEWNEEDILDEQDIEQEVY